MFPMEPLRFTLSMQNLTVKMTLYFHLNHVMNQKTTLLLVEL